MDERQCVPRGRADRFEQRLLGAAAQNAVREASRNYQDLRVAEVIEMDVLIEAGLIIAYRTKLRLSVKAAVTS